MKTSPIDCMSDKGLSSTSVTWKFGSVLAVTKGWLISDQG